MNKFFIAIAAVILVAGGTMVGEDPVLETPDQVAASVKKQLREEAREQIVTDAINKAK